MLKEVIENIFRDMLFLFLQQEPFFQEKNNSFLNFVLFNKNIESDIFNRLMDVFFLFRSSLNIVQYRFLNDKCIFQ